MELSPALHLPTPTSDPGAEEPAIKVGIVGCGSRGLTVLERLSALASSTRRRVEINVFDPHRPGPGLHSVEQPDYLMLNTVASQISMFPDQAALGGFSGRHGPTFYEWCLRFKSADRPVRPDEFLPRQWLGEYLAWTYDEVIQTLPDHVRVTHHAKLVDKIEHTDLGGFVLSTALGDEHQVDWLLITIGHAEAPPLVENVSSVKRLQAYPQPFSLQQVLSTDAVGIEGLGLSAMDAVAGLTVGRGGQFKPGRHELRYLPSGQEPRLFMYSRSGLPYRTRPDISHEGAASSPLIFTLSAVADLRAENPAGLDFEAQVLPMIKAEMLAQYFGMIAALNGDSSIRTKSELATAFLLGNIEAKAEELALRYAVPLLDPSIFDPRYLHSPKDDYPQWVKALIHKDIHESVKSLTQSPTKAAIEVWRSCREQLRRVVDNRGLTADSHRTFFREYAPLVNRMVAGPQKERHQELLALEEAGVLQWVHGSQVIHNLTSGAVSVALAADQSVALNAVVCAHLGGNQHISAQPKIIRQLRESGIVHSLTDEGEGLYVDAHSKAQPNLWITGPIVEGATYYNHYVPSSGSYSRAFVDADRIAREMLGIYAEVSTTA